ILYPLQIGALRTASQRLICTCLWFTWHINSPAGSGAPWGLRPSRLVVVWLECTSFDWGLGPEVSGDLRFGEPIVRITFLARRGRAHNLEHVFREFWAPSGRTLCPRQVRRQNRFAPWCFHRLLSVRRCSP